MKFLKSVRDIMKKVTWPTGKQLRRDTLVVIQSSVMFAIFFFLVDSGVQAAIAWILSFTN